MFMIKCKKCGAPLEGFLYNTIGKLLGLKPSAKDPELCNKCETEPTEKAEEKKETVEEVVTKPAEPEATATPESDIDKDDLIS
jgi:hypothetical protein